jgi:hypothetical protein
MPATIGTMPRQRKSPTTTIRIPQDLARMVRVIAAAREEDASDYLDHLLRPMLEKELRRLGQSLSERKEKE